VPGGLPADLPAAASQLQDAVARNLDSLADSTRDGAARPSIDLAAALAAVESALVSFPSQARTDEAAVVVEQRLELYRSLVGLVSELEPEPVNRVTVHTGPGGR
jgi:hypothetical protein